MSVTVSHACWLSLTVSLITRSCSMSLTVSCGCWLSLIFSPCFMELLHVSHCLQWLMSVSHSFSGNMELLHVSRFHFQFHKVAACLSQFLLWLLSLSPSAMELLHVSHCLQ